LAFSLAHSTSRSETGCVLRSLWGTLAPRFPWEKPRSASDTNCQPRLVVTFDQSGQSNAKAG
jgi:hypothetical protein